jgi:hypothetical protein
VVKQRNLERDSEMNLDQRNLENELILEKEIYMVNQRNLERTFEGKNQDIR